MDDDLKAVYDARTIRLLCPHQTYILHSRSPLTYFPLAEAMDS